mmetsp:Transcript_31524/g.57290  ORF Transcript_31524/g.57290 Transcript_31524/m.57290 type:complete len:200 (+) Transcript_31524:2510-3109(+)
MRPCPSDVLFGLRAGDVHPLRDGLRQGLVAGHLLRNTARVATIHGSEARVMRAFLCSSDIRLVRHLMTEAINEECPVPRVDAVLEGVADGHCTRHLVEHPLHTRGAPWAVFKLWDLICGAMHCGHASPCETIAEIAHEAARRHHAVLANVHFMHDDGLHLDLDGGVHMKAGHSPSHDPAFLWRHFLVIHCPSHARTTER